MPQIKQYYQQLYKKDMVKAVEDDISGDYKKLLVAERAIETKIEYMCRKAITYFKVVVKTLFRI